MKAVLAFLATSCLCLMIRANPITITVPETKDDEPTPADYRLNEPQIKPINYKIDLALNYDFVNTKKFAVQNCDISFNIIDDLQVPVKKEIRIHYALDFVDDTKVQLFAKDSVKPMSITIAAPNPKTEIAVITTEEHLEASKGPYTLKFTKLSGTLRDNMSGFYLSTYKHAGVDKYIATTQFQSTDARAAFPCFDEPSFKATFDISIRRPNTYTTVLGNAHKTGDDVEEGGFLTTTFGTTPIMSTYLVAFIVSTFESTSDPATPKYAIYHPEGMGDSAKYADAMTSRIVDDLGSELAITYSDLGNEQLFQAAIPDFSAGAMENWGLATYRETALLWNAKDSTARNKQRVCSVMAHEIAHMWFGDYVTMDWWSEAWLNEGFARYFEYHTTANVEPTFKMRDQFVLEQQQVIFNADAVTSALPLSSDEAAIYTRNQIDSKFGSITYNKGGSVLRMIERAMGDTQFFTALKQYLTENKHGNTIASTLIAVLEDNGLKAGAMIEWVRESGYPVVTVNRNGNDVALSQQRFLLDGKTSTTKWTIPITYSNKVINPDYTETTPKIWMEKAAATTTIIDGFKDTDIIILNVQGSGYYRVNYERDLLERIIVQLRTADKGKIPSLNRAILIDDIMNMARVGLQSYDTALDLTTYLTNEVEYYPWVAAFSSFAFLNKRIGQQEVADWFKNYVTRLSAKLYESVSFDIKEGANHIEILKTVLALQWGCDLGITGCITKSKELFAGYVTAEAGTANPIDPNVRSIAYCNAIRYGTKEDWTFLYGVYNLVATPASEKVAIILALGCSKDAAVINEFLLDSLDSNKIRKQDAYSVFTAVVNGNPENLVVAFNFLIEKFADIRTSYASMNALTNIFNVLADRFTTTDQVKKFDEFLKANAEDLGEAVSAGESAIATANANMEWSTKFQESIRSWLSRERGVAPALTASVLVIAMAVCVTFFH